MGSSTHRGLPWPEDPDDADGPEAFQALAEAVDFDTPFTQGAIATTRPVSTPGSPGVEGRWHYDDVTDLLYYDYGEGWTTINPGASSAPTEVFYAQAASTANVNVASAPSTLDGVTLTSGRMVLLKNQSTASQNGPYLFNGAGNALTRAAGGDTGDELRDARLAQVEAGTTLAETLWVLTTDGPITLGSTSLAYGQVGAQATVLYVPVTNESMIGHTATAPGLNTPQGLAVNGNNVTAVTLGSGSAPFAGMPLYAADFAVPGKTTVLRLRTVLATDETAAGASFTITLGLYPLTVVAGVHTLGTVIAGSTVAYTNPATNATLGGVTADFAFPTDGLYIFGAVVTGAVGAASSGSEARFFLEARTV